MATRTRRRQPANRPTASSLCWFDIPADDLDRAKKFYGSLFGWKFAPISAVVPNYWHVDTGGPDASPDGGLMPRPYPGQSITNYVRVKSLRTAVSKVETLGGRVCKPRTAVPNMGYFAICRDPEHNEFALWEMNPHAK